MDDKVLLDQRIQGVTKLDQQFVYAPLGALAAAVYAVVAHRVEFQSIEMAAWIPRAYWAVVVLIVLGLTRNRYRHFDLSTERHRLYGTTWTRRDRVLFEAGRPIFFALFLIAWTLGCAALFRLLSP